jgi:hypothetical protein
MKAIRRAGILARGNSRYWSRSRDAKRSAIPKPIRKAAIIWRRAAERVVRG